jgi:hypothetical protein
MAYRYKTPASSYVMAASISARVALRKSPGLGTGVAV